MIKLLPWIALLAALCLVGGCIDWDPARTRDEHVRSDVAEMVTKAAERLRFCATKFASEHLSANISASDLAAVSVAACEPYAQRVQDATSITDPVSAAQARQDAERTASDAVLRLLERAGAPPAKSPRPGETQT